jgi:hypothetical protein
MKLVKSKTRNAKRRTLKAESKNITALFLQYFALSVKH